MGRRHDIHLTAGSAYVESEEELRALESGDKKLSAEHAQRTPEEVSTEITTMVNYMRRGIPAL